MTDALVAVEQPTLTAQLIDLAQAGGYLQAWAMFCVDRPKPEPDPRLLAAVERMKAAIAQFEERDEHGT